MKTILLLAALVMSSVPVKAEDTRIKNRAQVVGALADAECLVKYGKLPKEKVYEMIRFYINDHPQLIAAYSWALVSPKAKTLVKKLLPYQGFDCTGLMLSEEEADRLMLPYLK